MKKILLATSNVDKFKTVKGLFITAGLSSNEYEILSLADINFSGKDDKEHGSIVDRAKEKAFSVKEQLVNLKEYECVIGIDDGIELKGILRENVKDYVRLILEQNYLEEGELIVFPRAYCCIKNNKCFEIVSKISYKYKESKSFVIKENTYPLSQIAVPLNSNVALSQMNDDEVNAYYWQCCKNEILELVKFIMD